MKIKEGFVLRELGDTYIIILDKPGASVDMSSLLSFNESAAWLWRRAEGIEFDEKDLVGFLCDEYDITPEYAAEEVARIVAQWREYGLVEG